LVSEEFRQRLFVDIPFLQTERQKLEDTIIQKEKELY